MRHIAATLSLLALALAGCGRRDDELQGYAEGKFVMLAPDASGRITVINAAEGAHVDSGAVLFQLEDTTEHAALDAAQASAAAAGARFDDAAAGGREPEIAAARDQLAQARATQVKAAADRQRFQALFVAGTIARAQLDEAVAAASTADAQVAELRQRLTITALPARENALRALQADATSAEAQARAAAETLRRRSVAAPAAGRVERLIRRAGDLAGPSLPAIRFLPDGNVRAILFIPEPQLARLPVGSRLAVQCDGCPADAAAEILSVADEAEYTPPVIYSDAERARLVYRAEARFTGFAPPPGTPLRLQPAKGK